MRYVIYEICGGVKIRLKIVNFEPLLGRLNVLPGFLDELFFPVNILFCYIYRWCTLLPDTVCLQLEKEPRRQHKVAAVDLNKIHAAFHLPHGKL